MTKPPDDDRELIHFLRQNRSQPSPASPDLEERIMAAIAQPPVSQKIYPRRWYQSQWMPPVAIAASLVAGLISYRTLVPPPPSDAEIAAIETFVETSWDDTLNDDITNDTNSSLLD